MTLENVDGKIPIEVANSHESLLALLPHPLKRLQAVKGASSACISSERDVHAAAQYISRVLRHAWFWSCCNKGEESKPPLLASFSTVEL
eukprot:scaffold8814_cov19-Tisochrysis_lutea.AAC.2